MKSKFIKCDESTEGRSIEQVIRECIENNTPIENVVTPLYEERDEGVRPETDIRTDRWEIAQSATDKLYQAEVAKRQNAPVNGEHQTEEE